MKKVLGVIVAILGALIFFSFLVLLAMSGGCSFGTAILGVSITVSIPAVIFCWVWLVAWLLD